MVASYTHQRLNMLESQIKPFSVFNEAVLEAFEAIPREDFIPDERRGLAYLGEELPMGEGRFLLEPAVHARLLQEAGVASGMRALDIGCLTGYSTAILSSLCSHVCGVDSQEWIMQAKKIAENSGLAVPDFYIGALTDGLSMAAPYDLIVINGAVQTIPQAIADQVVEGGKIATFYRAGRGSGYAVLYHKHKGNLRQQTLFDAFVPLLPGFAKAEGFEF
jgi:protein-L-isoaspartate(D-aspartate) O-methyltransferase